MTVLRTIHGAPPQGWNGWFRTFEEAYRTARWKRGREKVYVAAREAQERSELPLTVAEVRRVIETAWFLDPGRFRR
jgi:hypothetical protein